MSTRKDFLIVLNFASLQAFLEAARRTRDLWYGSWIASELSKAMARELYNFDAELIFPSPPNPKNDLLPNSTFQVANKVVAKICIDDKENPDKLISIVKNAANERWKEIATDSLNYLNTKSNFRYEKLRNRIIDEKRWRIQINEPFEIYSAWLRIDKPDNYQNDTRRLELLLARRKLSRLFDVSPLQVGGLEKSSLDGRRETVLSDKITPSIRRRLGINDNEALDTIGLVKRLGGRFNSRAEQFTPLTRIAMDPWIRKLPGESLNEIKTAIDQKKKLFKVGLISNVKGNDGCYKEFPYDGQLLYPFRLDAELQKLKDNENNSNSTYNLLETLRKELSPIWKKNGIPPTTVAILTADGDKMGETIRKFKEMNQHKKFSQ